MKNCTTPLSKQSKQETNFINTTTTLVQPVSLPGFSLPGVSPRQTNTKTVRSRAQHMDNTVAIVDDVLHLLADDNNDFQTEKQ
jgi:hypothetical protein